MKRNLFFIIFIIFASTVFYRYGRTKSHSSKKIQVINKVTAPTPEIASNKHTKALKASPMAIAKSVPMEQVPDLPIFPQLQKLDTASLEAPLRNYAELKNNALDAIPLKDKIREEAKINPHFISPKLLKAGKKLGALKSFILKYPENQAMQKEAREFYEQCASYGEYPNSIRSLCLYNRRTLAKNRGKNFDITPYPKNIRKVIQNPAL